ncbi:hypothetical protein [Micromonospora lupini]|uniref:hypothetical protein n=1 Tax=Micromonospora lupini TaxID=285679 RepID=UPI0031DF1EBC
MLPVALTCPLWWVARWATRVLTSLAVIAALALGAAAPLPGSPAPTAAASTFAVEPPASSDRPAAVTATRPAPPTVDGRAVPRDSTTVDGRAVRGSATVVGGRAVRGSATVVGGRAVRDSATVVGGRAARDSATVDGPAVRDRAAVGEAGSAWSADPPPVLHGRPGDLPAASTGVASAPATSDWSPRVDTAGSRAPRAPPERRITPGR